MTFAIAVTALIAVVIVAVGVVTAALVIGIKYCKAKQMTKEQTTTEQPHESQPAVPENEDGGSKNQPNMPGNQPKLPREKANVPRNKPNIPENQSIMKEKAKGTDRITNTEASAKLPGTGRPDSTYEMPEDFDTECENSGCINGQYDCINMADISTDVDMCEPVNVEK